MTTIPGFYTITEAGITLSLTKIGAGKVARAEGWQAYRVGNVNLYPAEEIHEYRAHRQRTQLVKALGWHGRGLYRCDDIDIECPECGAFTVKWPAPPELPEKYLCLKGHEGELHEAY